MKLDGCAASKLLSSCLTIIACVACVPIPHQVTLSPRLLGRLSNSNGPIGGAEIRLSIVKGDFSCSKFEKLTNTDDSGQFDLSASKEAHLFFSGGDALNWWVTCILVDNKLYIGDIDFRIGPIPEVKKLQCQIRRHSRNLPQYTPISESDAMQFAICSADE